MSIPPERQYAWNRILQRIQQERFKMEVEYLLNNKSVNKRSILRSIDPFVDTDGLLKVKGRSDPKQSKVLNNFAKASSHQIVIRTT